MAWRLFEWAAPMALQDDTINLGALAALHSLDVICLQVRGLGGAAGHNA